MRCGLVLLVLMLSGCGDAPPRVVQGSSTAESRAPCTPPATVSAPLPDGFPQPPPGVELTAVTEGSVSGRVAGPVGPVVAHFRAALDRAGYVVSREEDEGRSVVLGFFGARGDGTLVVATLSCPPDSTGFTATVHRTTP